MVSTIGHSLGIVILVGLAILVGMKLMHDQSGNTAAGGGPTYQPNAVNPATGPSSFKY